MKIFQIYEGFCHWDATQTVGSLENTKKMFPPTDLFVEAPDYVFEGWGYDKLTGEFIKPNVPEGWHYDDATGTIYGGNTPDVYATVETSNITLNQMLNAIKAGINSI